MSKLLIPLPQPDGMRPVPPSLFGVVTLEALFSQGSNGTAARKKKGKKKRKKRKILYY